MRMFARTKSARISGVITLAILIAMLATVGPSACNTALADPPADQEYTGAKRCASCHFKQYMTWKKTKHAKSFDLLPDKYKKDADCLKCHTTGFGQPTGYKDEETTASLAGTTCETCHGPGSKHEVIAKPFAKVKELTAEQEKSIRDSIWKMLPKNVCVECHMVQGHKESATPKELRDK